MWVLYGTGVYRSEVDWDYNKFKSEKDVNPDKIVAIHFGKGLHHVPIRHLEWHHDKEKP